MSSQERVLGPWRAQLRGDDDWGVYGDNGESIVAVGLNDDEARLIAAAPDLLAACFRLVRFAEELCEEVRVSTHYPSIEAAHAAIEKATGEAQS